MLTTLSRLWTALGRLAAAVEDLAGTVEETNHGIRGQLGLPSAINRLPVPVEIETVHANGSATTENGTVKRRSRQGQYHPSCARSELV